MGDHLRTYEEQQFAKHHYRKLITVKPTIKHFQTPKTIHYSASRTLTPIDHYEYTLANDKIRNKLTEIYKEPADRVKKKRKRKNQHHRSSPFQSKQKQKSKEIENVKMFQRIVAAKSSLCNMKQREKSLKQYSSITRKNRPIADENLFHAYRELIVDSRIHSTRPLRHSRTKKSSTKNRPNSGHTTIRSIRQTL